MSDENGIGDSARRFGDNVRRRREQLGWSQSELARKMNEVGWPKYNQMSVSRTEDGARAARLDEAVSLAAALSTQLSTLMMPTPDGLAVERLRGWIEQYRERREELNDAALTFESVRESLAHALRQTQAALAAGQLGPEAVKRLSHLVPAAEELAAVGWTDALEQLRAQYREQRQEEQDRGRD